MSTLLGSPANECDAQHSEAQVVPAAVSFLILSRPGHEDAGFQFGQADMCVCAFSTSACQVVMAPKRNRPEASDDQCQIECTLTRVRPESFFASCVAKVFASRYREKPVRHTDKHSEIDVFQLFSCQCCIFRLVYAIYIWILGAVFTSTPGVAT